MPDFGGLVGQWNVEVSVLREGVAALAVVLLAQDRCAIVFSGVVGLDAQRCVFLFCPKPRGAARSVLLASRHGGCVHSLTYSLR
jgi:hypothetical protein